MLDSISVPRRSYDFEDYIDILRRNIGWLIAPAFAGLVIATVVAYLQEDTYISSATIRVVPQQISTKLYDSFTSQDVADRMNSMAQTVLSRQALTGMINNYGLYKKDVKSMPMEDVIEKMRGRGVGLRVSEGVAAGGKTLPAMQISFAYPDRLTAQKICQELVSRFIDTSSNDISNTQSAAFSFIDDETKQTKEKLDLSEKKLADFRTANAGHLPEEVQTNSQQLNSLGGQLASYNSGLNQITVRRMILESQMNMAKDRLAAVRNPDLMAHNDRLNDINGQIKQMDLTILSLKQRYTDDHPDLEVARDRLAFLKKQKDEISKEKVNTADAKYDPTTATADRMNAENQIESYRVQMKALDMQEAQARRDIAKINAGIQIYQSRLVGIPASEREYGDLLRDYDLAKKNYIDAESKRQFSSQGIRLEQRKQGQTLELIDPASLPTTPAAPKREKTLPVGLVAGLFLGIVIVAIREFKDTSLKNLKDARMYTQLNILGSVPLLENDVVVQRRKQVMWISWATGTVAGLLIMGASVARYYWSRG